MIFLLWQIAKLEKWKHTPRSGQPHNQGFPRVKAGLLCWFSSKQFQVVGVFPLDCPVGRAIFSQPLKMLCLDMEGFSFANWGMTYQSISRKVKCFSFWNDLNFVLCFLWINQWKKLNLEIDRILNILVFRITLISLSVFMRKIQTLRWTGLKRFYDLCCA
jgi:hypothetical protein